MFLLRTTLLVAALASHGLSGAAAAPVDDFVSQLSDAMLKRQVGAGWKQHGKTAKLDLFYKNIGDAGATALARALEKDTVLTWLQLQRTKIGDAGATALARALEQNTVLGGLVLEDNNIGDVGAIALARALDENTELANLWLTNNKISDSGAIALCRLQKKNRKVTLRGIDEAKCKRAEKREEEEQKDQKTTKEETEKTKEKELQSTKTSELRRFLSTHNMKEHFGILTA